MDAPAAATDMFGNCRLHGGAGTYTADMWGTLKLYVGARTAATDLLGTCWLNWDARTCCLPVGDHAGFWPPLELLLGIASLIFKQSILHSFSGGLSPG